MKDLQKREAEVNREKNAGKNIKVLGVYKFMNGN